jgi:hypothetical protein
MENSQLNTPFMFVIDLKQIDVHTAYNQNTTSFIVNTITAWRNVGIHAAYLAMHPQMLA